jgi:hypothetical protein
MVSRDLAALQRMFGAKPLAVLLWNAPADHAAEAARHRIVLRIGGAERGRSAAPRLQRVLGGVTGCFG